MTIIHLITTLGLGGAQNMVLELSKKSKQSSKTIVIALIDKDKRDLKFIENNIECYYLNIYSLRQLGHGLKKLHSIANGCKELVLHCHMFHACVLGIFYKVIFKNMPIIFTLHTNSVKQFYRKMFMFLSKKLRYKDVIFSENATKWYLNNNLIIPNGVDFNNLTSEVKDRDYVENSTFVFLFLGRLSEPKNPLYLIDLANKLKERNIVNFIINVAGEGKLEEELKLLIIKNNLGSNIKLLGFKQEVKPYLLNSHCLILPSLWEGMPITIIEAAATKLPIISTPVGSIPDFLNNENAYLSNLKGFHQVMIEVIKNYSESKIKANKLFSEVKRKYDMNVVYKNHIEVYKDSLKNNFTV